MFPSSNYSFSPSTMFSVCASLSGFSMLFRSMLNDFVPDQLRSYIYENVLGKLFTPSSKNLTLIIDENSKYKKNLVYEAAEMYLRTKIGPETERLRVAKTPKQKHLNVTIAKGEAIRDTFEDIQVKWLYVQTEKENSEKVKRYYELTFEKKLRERVLDSYLNHVIAESEKIKRDLRVVNLYSRDVPGSRDDDGSSCGSWGCISLEHPSTFDTLAMDPSAKKKIIDDLERFLKRKEFYKRVGKAWKRGYLLYGPPGTGKSSLIAAMANYLKFDVFDLDLSNIYDNGELKRILLSTTNRSILVIEDIDCNAEVRDREDENQEIGKARGKRKRRDDEYDDSEDQDTQLTLSGILNFIDGLWSSFGDERIIVFTTNHKDRLDPALLRPGRMDMHINMSYCTGLAFRTLVSNYLGLDGLNHPLCEEIEKLIDSTEVTPAELAEELMQDDDTDVVLRGVISFVEKRKDEKSKVKAQEDVSACNEVVTKIDDSDGKQNSTKNQKQAESMAMLVEPPNGIKQQGKHYYSMWQTLFEIDTKYVPIKPIGRGAYGVVCSSINRETNEKVAIKKIHNVFENRVDALRTLRELKLLRHVRHDNVIALKDVMLPTNKSSFKDVYLPGNLLVNANCDLKICDFGLARTSQGNEQFMTEYVVTRWYRAPELLLCCDNYGTSIDVWSVGCIFAEILGRKPIFPGTECLNQLKLIINVVGSQQESDIRFIDNPKARRFIKSLPYSRGTHLSNLYPQANPLAIDLLQRMLVFDPTKRISVTDALSHPYMAGLFDPGSNPPAHVPISLDIDENMEERMIREMMWDEMLYYHPGAETANP
ncbi:hypothetical protein IGI04_033947 [Brassica rapa subsp. trilocularis]|uniref:Protein kinase domain-containing protein n=1 Tax=Brassica rapa subsp. trilocularis TaxID=1813537 RepID=A0ABQ7L7D2_BRACM|nr:hypothetical protein IGI04_033947 [Brassica rapa subsp. trilocularis]